MKKRTMRLLLLIAMTLLPACGLGGGSSEAECNEEGTLFLDTFEEGRNCGWTLYTQGGAAVAIEEGTLQISTSQPGQPCGQFHT